MLRKSLFLGIIFTQLPIVAMEKHAIVSQPLAEFTLLFELDEDTRTLILKHLLLLEAPDRLKKLCHRIGELRSISKPFTNELIRALTDNSLLARLLDPHLPPFLEDERGLVLLASLCRVCQKNSPHSPLEKKLVMRMDDYEKMATRVRAIEEQKFAPADFSPFENEVASFLQNRHSVTCGMFSTLFEDALTERNYFISLLAASCFSKPIEGLTILVNELRSDHSLARWEKFGDIYSIITTTVDKSHPLLQITQAVRAHAEGTNINAADLLSYFFALIDTPTMLNDLLIHPSLSEIDKALLKAVAQGDEASVTTLISDVSYKPTAPLIGIAIMLAGLSDAPSRSTIGTKLMAYNVEPLVFLPSIFIAIGRKDLAFFEALLGMIRQASLDTVYATTMEIFSTKEQAFLTAFLKTLEQANVITAADARFLTNFFSLPDYIGPDISFSMAEVITCRSLSNFGKMLAIGASITRGNRNYIEIFFKILRPFTANPDAMKLFVATAEKYNEEIADYIRLQQL